MQTGRQKTKYATEQALQAKGNTATYCKYLETGVREKGRSGDELDKIQTEWNDRREVTRLYSTRNCDYIRNAKRKGRRGK